MTTDRTTGTRWVLPVVSVAVALVVLGPALGPGFVLVYDMVFAPTHALTPDALGLGSSLPRAVPVDAVVALATAMVPGEFVQKAALALALAGATYGAARLVPTDSTGARIVAGITYAWSAYVAERLFIGHWALLLAYAALPWVALAARKLRTTNNIAPLILATIPAALTPTGGILAAGIALSTAGRRRIPHVAAISVILNAPWWVPSILHPAGGLSDPAAVELFGARGENWAGPVVSVLGLGGIWNADTVPSSRANPILPVLIVATTVIALIGLRKLRHRWETAAPILLGGVGLLLATLASLPLGDDILRLLVDTVPGAGLLRDSQKWVAWWALPFALGVALAVERAGRAVLVVAAVFPIAVLPDLAWGGWGRLQPVSYPDDWHRVAAVLADDPHPGDVLALPLSAFRQFAWNDHRTQLDPAPRFLPRPTVIDDTLYVDGKPITGEDPRVAAIRDSDDPARHGIGWILIEHGTPGPANLPDNVTRVYEGQWLSLYRVPDPEPPAARNPLPVLAADFAAVLLIVGALLSKGLPNGRLSPSRPGRAEE